MYMVMRDSLAANIGAEVVASGRHRFPQVLNALAHRAGTHRQQVVLVFEFSKFLRADRRRPRRRRRLTTRRRCNGLSAHTAQTRRTVQATSRRLIASGIVDLWILPWIGGIARPGE